MIFAVLGLVLSATPLSIAEEPGAAPPESLAELKRSGALRSRFRDFDAEKHAAAPADQRPEADLARFESTIRPLLRQHCVDCHGPDVSEASVRVDTLDPNLLTGGDTDWWTEIFAVVTKGEMPPPDAGEMDEADRQQIVEWLSGELQAASIARRKSGSGSGFRRLTRYEYNYALQDLLGLPWNFAKDLPPDPRSEEGFRNSSELLHLSVSQFQTYHRLARLALDRATYTGKRPETLRWNIPMDRAARREWAKQDEQLAKANKKLADKPEELAAELDRLEKSFRQRPGGAFFKQMSTGRMAAATWRYHGARYALSPDKELDEISDGGDCFAILPPGSRHKLIFELGNQLPDEGTLRVTVHASRTNPSEGPFPSLQLLFGWQASNEGRALLRVSDRDVPVTAPPADPQVIQWDVPLGEIYPRNTVRKTSPMGATPSPSEYIRLINSAASPADIQIHHVRVESPFFDQWPPRSHRAIFFASENADRDNADNETEYAGEILRSFMTRAWRRPVTDAELRRKLKLFSMIRPQCETFEEAVVEVLATVLASPQFLYVTENAAAGSADSGSTDEPALDAFQLATRLSLFLWCSVPDAELHRLAASGELTKPDVLQSQVERMLDDRRSDRFAEHFVNQWLNLELLEFVNFKQHVRGFDPLLKEAMQHEPAAFFGEMLRTDASLLDLIHADYAMVNERLAKHYGFRGVHGNHFRRVALDGRSRRGGLLTQAGPLAMNSDWPDSHPLKRAIWLLECVLNDPPPPPPPAVPQIDVADPEIAKMTLKERLEDHRNQAACKSCHIKIDPWGIAFENYDALGRWRDQIRGQPVDASSELFNRQTLDGMDGLKRFLLESRQDQFVRAMVHKLATYALGRPLAFEDRADVDAVTATVRKNGDGLKSAILAIVQSPLFQQH